jgi:hypothetical protein
VFVACTIGWCAMMLALFAMVLRKRLVLASVAKRFAAGIAGALAALAVLLLSALRHVHW